MRNCGRWFFDRSIHLAPLDLADRCWSNAEQNPTISLTASDTQPTRNESVSTVFDPDFRYATKRFFFITDGTDPHTSEINDPFYRKTTEAFTRFIAADYPLWSPCLSAIVSFDLSYTEKHHRNDDAPRDTSLILHPGNKNDHCPQRRYWNALPDHQRFVLSRMAI